MTAYFGVFRVSKVVLPPVLEASIFKYSLLFCMLQVIKMLLESPENPDIELLALCINLATNKRTAQIICAGQVTCFTYFGMFGLLSVYLHMVGGS